MTTGTSKRLQITKALSEKFKLLDGTTYTTNIYGNSYPKLKFWDEVVDFPCAYMTPGTENREYLPGGFKWGHLNITIKLYCKGDNSQEELEQLLGDVELIIDANRVLVYDTVNSYETTEIEISSITTDEGMLAPYAVGEIVIQVQYAL